MEVNVVSHILFTVVCSLLVFFAGLLCLKKRELIFLSVSVFILKSVIIYLFFQMPGIFENNFFIDSKAYHQAILKTKNYFQIFSGLPSNFTYNLWDTQVSYFYILIVTPFYLGFTSASTGFLLNSFFYLLALIFFYRLIFNEDDSRRKELAFVLLLLWPSIFFNSLLFIRDGLILLLIAFFFTCYTKRVNVPRFFLIVLCIFLEMGIRWYVGVSLILFIIADVALLIGKRNKIFLPVFGLFFFVALFAGMNYLGFTLDVVQGFRNILTGLEGSYNANSVYLKGYVIDSYPKLVMFIPLSSFYFLYSPFLPVFSNPLSLIAFIENIILLGMSAYIFLPNKSMPDYKLSKELKKFFLFSIPLLFVYSFGVADSGTAMRQKGFMIFIIVFAFYKKRLWALIK